MAKKKSHNQESLEECLELLEHTDYETEKEMGAKDAAKSAVYRLAEVLGVKLD